jgi:peptidoglycan/LPS O-acetylase OafA/YrhL
LFIEPGWLNYAFSTHFRALEGPFWSLFVEVKFYVLFGSLYFLFGARRAVSILFVLFVVTVCFKFYMIKHPHAHAAIYWTNYALKRTSAEHFGWFTFGATFYLYMCDRSRLTLSAAIVSAAVAVAFFDGSHLIEKIPPALMIILFAASMMNEKVQRLLQHKAWLILGLASYPLYLIHENAVVSLTVQLGRLCPSIPAALLPLGPIILLACIAWTIATYFEPTLRRTIRLAFRRLSDLAMALRRIGTSQDV